MAKKKKPKKLTNKQKKFIKKNYKVIIILLVVVLIALAIVGFFFKDEILKLINGPEPEIKIPTTEKVKNVKITNEGMLSWNSAGEGAEYTIIINGIEIKTQDTTYDITQHKNEINDGLVVEIYAKVGNHNISNKNSVTIIINPETALYEIDHKFVYEGYYSQIKYEMTNEQIFNKLNEIINVVTAGNGSQNSSYGEVREILVKSDIEPGKNTLYGIYDNAEIPANWGSGNVFQREHVWPNSKLGIPRVTNSSRDQGSDPHNLRAIIGSTNSSRSNRHFAAGSGLKGYTIGTDEYYPGDNHRGDVARILLYMAVRYKDILSLVEVPQGPTYEPAGAQMGRLSLLLEWHNADPVDEFEENRNQVIYEYQGNRNPFIDHPELFEKVYEHIVSISLKTPKPYHILQLIIDNIQIYKNTYINNKEKYLL